MQFSIEPQLINCSQLIIVQAKSWNTCEATIQWFERNDHGAWEPVDEAFEVVVGKNGMAPGRNLLPANEIVTDIANKKEGDHKTPEGLFGFCFAFGYAKEKEVSFGWPYLQVDENFVGVDDPKSFYYNCIVNKSVLQTPDWNSAEIMYRPDGLYKWGLLIDYNFGPTIPGEGSQIFLHIWRGPGQGTEGCTAMPEDKMLALLRFMDPNKNILIWQTVGSREPSIVI